MEISDALLNEARQVATLARSAHFQPSPAEGRKAVDITRRRVLLPLPLCPMMPTTSPGSRLRVTPRSAQRVPKRRARPWRIRVDLLVVVTGSG